MREKPLYLAFALLADSVVRLFRVSRWRKHETILALQHIGVESVPIISIATAFSGVVVSTEIAWHMNRALQSVSMIPGFTGQFILRELGIAVPAFLLVAKSGAAMTAEIATMRTTEQIDALRLLGIDPRAYLVFPRFVATILASVCLTLISLAITLACTVTVSVLRFGFSGPEYLNALRAFVGWPDLVCALAKAVAFGAAIPCVSCAWGLSAKTGAEGVGEATTQAVVTSTLAVIFLDFALTFALRGWLVS